MISGRLYRLVVAFLSGSAFLTGFLNYFAARSALLTGFPTHFAVQGHLTDPTQAYPSGPTKTVKKH